MPGLLVPTRESGFRDIRAEYQLEVDRSLPSRGVWQRIRCGRPSRRLVRYFARASSAKPTGPILPCEQPAWIATRAIVIWVELSIHRAQSWWGNNDALPALLLIAWLLSLT